MWGILINSRSKYKDFTPSHICCETWETKTRKSTKNPKTKSRTDCLLPIEQPGKFDILKMQTEVEKFSHWKLGLFLEKQGLEAPQVNSACRRGHAAWLRSHLKATDPVRPVLTWFLSHWGRCRTALQTGTETSWRQDYSTKFTSTGDVIFLTQ